jgi:hypothetical protein
MGKKREKTTRKSTKISKSTNTSKKKSGWIYLFLPFKYLFLAIWWLLRGIFRAIYWLAEKIVSFVARERPSKGRLKSGNPSRISVLETYKGTFRAIWNKISNSDSMIGIIVGARGSGKSAIALSILENLRGTKKKFFAMGFQSKDLPNWIEVIEGVEQIENDSIIVIDEGGILFSSRDSMSNSNKILSDLLMIARHKNLTIIFISQNSSNIEINTLRQADFLILKKSSLLQKDFERKKISEIYNDYAGGFEKYKSVPGLALIYSDQFIGFVENELPSFWSTKVSKGFSEK